jgi:hypothetical protein
MYQLFLNIGFFSTLVLTFISNHYAPKIKRLSELKSITNIMQIDAYFDLFVWYYKGFENLKIIVLFFSLTFPINVILNGLFPRFKNYIYFWLTLIFSFIIYYKVDYNSLGVEKGNFLIPCITLKLLAILVCSYNVIKHKRILQPVNYLYFLLLGFMILDFFWYLGFQNVILNNFNSFWYYHYFYVIYLMVFRFIYIYYVIKYLRSFWIFKKHSHCDKSLAT